VLARASAAGTIDRTSSVLVASRNFPGLIAMKRVERDAR
jgi:hypothetical protein